MADELPKIRIDTNSHRAWFGGQPLHLTVLEFALLTYLAERVGSVVARRDILQGVWGSDWQTGKSLDMLVSFIRRKLGDDPKNPRYLTTVRGIGLRLEAGTIETQQQAGPDTSLTRVVLVKRGDILAFGRVGEVSERVAATAATLRDQLGLAGVLLFEGDIEMTALPGTSL